MPFTDRGELTDVGADAAAHEIERARECRVRARATCLVLRASRLDDAGIAGEIGRNVLQRLMRGRVVTDQCRDAFDLLGRAFERLLVEAALLTILVRTGELHGGGGRVRLGEARIELLRGD